MNVLTKFRQKLSFLAETLGRTYGGTHILTDFWSDILIDSKAKPMGLGSDTLDFGIWCGFSTTQSYINIADSNKDIPNWWSIEEGGVSSKFPGSSNLTVGPYHTVTMLRDYTYVDYDINKIIVSPLWPFVSVIDDGVIVPRFEMTAAKEEDLCFIDAFGAEFTHDIPEETIIRDDNDIIPSLAFFGEKMGGVDLSNEDW